jgi:hypothetical protein
MVSAMATNGLKKQLENWHQINWRKAIKTVRNLRQRIFRARKLGDFRKLRSVAVVDTKELRQSTIVSSAYYPDQSGQGDGRH